MVLIKDGGGMLAGAALVWGSNHVTGLPAAVIVVLTVLLSSPLRAPSITLGRGGASSQTGQGPWGLSFPPSCPALSPVFSGG